MLTSACKNEHLFEEHLLVAASELESPFNSEYYEIFKSTYLKNICQRLLLKMCPWNWEKLKFILK